MSRSYRKNPVIKCAGDTSFKKIFNRKLRRTTKIDEIPDGNAYKRMNNSWEIYDFISRCSWQDFKSWEWTKDLTKEEKWSEWKKDYYSK